MSIERFDKDPDEVLDYGFNWADWLESGETISTYTIDAADGITVDSDSGSTTAVKVWLSGGTAGESYRIACEIVTDNATPRTAERSIYIDVKER